MFLVYHIIVWCTCFASWLLFTTMIWHSDLNLHSPDTPQVRALSYSLAGQYPRLSSALSVLINSAKWNAPVGFRVCCHLSPSTPTIAFFFLISVLVINSISCWHREQQSSLVPFDQLNLSLIFFLSWLILEFFWKQSFITDPHDVNQFPGAFISMRCDRFLCFPWPLTSDLTYTAGVVFSCRICLLVAFLCAFIPVNWVVLSIILHLEVWILIWICLQWHSFMTSIMFVEARNAKSAILFTWMDTFFSRLAPLVST